MKYSHFYPHKNLTFDHFGRVHSKENILAYLNALRLTEENLHVLSLLCY